MHAGSIWLLQGHLFSSAGFKQKEFDLSTSNANAYIECDLWQQRCTESFLIYSGQRKRASGVFWNEIWLRCVKNDHFISLCYYIKAEQCRKKNVVVHALCPWSWKGEFGCQCQVQNRSQNDIKTVKKTLTMGNFQHTVLSLKGLCNWFLFLLVSGLKLF
jgi:hypothetical protein